MQVMRRRQNWLIVIVIALVGLWLRVWGINFGLPYTYQIDELQYVDEAVQYLSTGDFRPANWANPTLLKYAFSGVYAGAFALRALPAQSLGGLQAVYDNDPTLFFLLARLVSALFGAGLIVSVYALAYSLYRSVKRGYVAAFLMALCFLPIRDSHYAVSDIPMTFFLVTALLFYFLYRRDARPRYLYIAAVLSGMAIATKYSAAVLVIFPITVTLVMLRHPIRLSDAIRAVLNRKIILAYILIGVVFIVIVPYAIFDFRNLLQSLRDHYGMGKIGFAGYDIDPDGGFLFYIKTMIWGMGLPLWVTAMIALVHAFVQRRANDILFLALPALLLYIYLGRQAAFFGRFILPALPLLIILSSSLICNVAERFIPSPSGARLAAAVLSILLIAPSAVSAVRHDYLLTQTDTRTLAKEWIEANLPDGTLIGAEWHTPPLYDGSERNTFVRMPPSTHQYQVVVSSIFGLAEHSLATYQKAKAQYLIVSSFIYDIPRLSAEEEAARRDFYAQLSCKAQLVKEFKPYSGDREPPFIFDQLYGPATSLFEFDRPGPTIRIYNLNAPPSEQTCREAAQKIG